MKKIFNICVILLLVIVLSGCGSTNLESNNNKEVSIDTILDNKNNYYLIVNGLKLKVGDKFSDVLKTGYTVKDNDLSETIPSNRYLLAKSIIGKEEYKAVFRVIPMNLSNSTVTVKDSIIGGFEVGDIDYDKLSSELLKQKIETYGGIKLGSTYEDMVRVFGTDYEVHESNPDGISDKLTYTVYKYKKSFKGFEFTFDKNNKLSKIELNNYSFE